jgi:putative flippase GtrA
MERVEDAPKGGLSAPQEAPKTGRDATRDATGTGLGAPIVRQFVKFGIVGVSNTVLTLAVYTVLLKVFGVWYLAASAIGFAVGTVNGFLWNRKWTFRGHVGDSLTPVRWFVVQGFGLVANLGLVFVFVHDTHMDKLLGQLCATGIVVVFTFFANRAWTFKMHPAADPAL